MNAIINTHYQTTPVTNITETPEQLENRYNELNRKIFNTTDDQERIRLFRERDPIQQKYIVLTGKTLEHVTR